MTCDGKRSMREPESVTVNIFGKDYTYFDKMVEMVFDQSFELLEEYITVIL